MAPETRAPRRRTSRLVVGLVLVGLGLGFVTFAATRPLTKRAAAAVEPTEFIDQSSCLRCPPGATLDGVEVEARVGSTLFVLRGAWPSSIGDLPVGLRLVANDVEVILDKPSTGGALVVTKATKGSVPLSPNAVAVGLLGDALLLDIGANSLAAPIAFEVGLWDGTSFVARLPKAGRLTWAGHGSPQPAADPGAPSAQVGPDLTGLAGACSAIPVGTVPPFLTVATTEALPPSPDPRTQTPARQVRADVGESPLDITTPYTVVVIVQPANTRAPTAQGHPIDQAGTTQLVLSFDGTTKRKAVRAFDGQQWSARIDDEAGDLTFVIKAASISFFWTGLHNGDHVGVVTAATTGCAASELDSNLVPLLLIP